MKNYSFYQYMKTQLNANTDIGDFAEAIIDDPLFPKYSTDFNEISNYLEKNPYTGISLSIFDDAYESYKQWLKF